MPHDALDRREPRTAPWRRGAGLVLLALYLAAALPFVAHSLRFGWGGLAGGLVEPVRFLDPGARATSAAIFLHMLSGGTITALAPLQLVAPIRVRAPALHRWTGRAIVALALVTGVTGLGYILARGTIGGPAMDAGFGLYGALLILAAVQALRHARAGDIARHRDWALRLFVLAIGSWIYRMHYTLWYLATGGLGSVRDFSGPFDQVQLFAFYLPYLVALELWFRSRDRRGARTMGGAA